MILEFFQGLLSTIAFVISLFIQAFKNQKDV